MKNTNSTKITVPLYQQLASKIPIDTIVKIKSNNDQLK
jgi:hypothetical protein